MSLLSETNTPASELISFVTQEHCALGQEREAENNLHNFRALGKRNQRGGEGEGAGEK